MCISSPHIIQINIKRHKKNRGEKQPKNCVRSEGERRTFKEQTVDAFYKLTEKAKIFMNEKLNVRKSCACAFMNFESFQSTWGNKKCFNIISLTHEHIQVRRSIALTRNRSFLALAEEIQCQYLHIKRRKGDKTHIHLYIWKIHSRRNFLIKLFEAKKEDK